ncbi:MAG: hypothetical protein WCJ72_03530 [Chryseobacterium sp.]
MNFKEWLISEEIFPNKTATVYHRTCTKCDEEQSVKSVSSILTSDFRAGAGVGCMYGCGLYTTFAIESQFARNMETYGKAVVKFKVTDLDKYLIFQLSVAKQIHGKDYKISDQLKKLGVLNKVDESKLKEYDEQQEKEKLSSVLAYEFYQQNRWMANSVKGIIYYGKNDGYCLLKYEPVQDGTITMLAYAVSEHNDMKKMEELKNNDGWIKSVGVLGTPIKNVYKYPIKNKEKFAIVDKEKREIENIKYIFLTSKNLEKTAQKFASNLNKFTNKNFVELLQDAIEKNKMAEVIAKYKKEISDGDVSILLKNSEDKDKIAELIVKYKKELNDDNVSELLQDATKKDKIAELIVKYKTELSDDNVSILLRNATDKEKIAELIIEKKPELSDDNVSILLRNATDKEAMAKTIANKKPELSDKNIYDLLDNATDKDAMAEYLIKKQPELSDNNVRDFLVSAKDKDKFVQIIINKKPELSDNNVSWFLDKGINKDAIADLIIKKQPYLSSDNVAHLLWRSINKDKFAEIIANKKPELSYDDIWNFFFHSTNKEKTAELIQKQTDNISRLSNKNVEILLRDSKDKPKLAQILNKYHTKKTSEIQEILDKYLESQAIAAR